MESTLNPRARDGGMATGATARRRMLGTAMSAAALALAGLVTLAAPAPAAAQAASSWPTKPIRIVVGFPAGSTTDTVARVAAEHLRVKLGQPVTVDNKPGANGLLGAGEVARAAPDGYTLLVTNSSSVVINPQLYRKAPYTTQDFAPVTMVVASPFILVVNPAGERTAKVDTVADLLAVAKANPGQVTYGSAGPGNIAHLAFEMLGNRTGTRSTHVPYKGAAQAQIGLMAGEVDALLDTPHGLPHMRSGKTRPLAITAGTRLPELPQVPTMAEAGVPDFDVTFWLAMLAPAGTPPAIVDRLYEAMKAVREDPKAMKQLEGQGGVTLTAPQAFGARIQKEAAMWGEIIRREKIQLD